MNSTQSSSVGAAARAVRPPFDTFTITLHWITAVVVLTLVVSGLLYTQVEEQHWAAPLLRVHRSLGVTIWTLTAVRLAWRVTGARFPEFPSSMTPMHRMGARVSEYALYALLLLQPATGVAQSIFRGRPFEVFAWNIPAFVPRDLTLVGIFHAAHEIGAWCMIGLVGLHATAALVHHFILRDDVLEAMAPVFRHRDSPAPRRASRPVRSTL
jgi:cytochrome b561